MGTKANQVRGGRASSEDDEAVEKVGAGVGESAEQPSPVTEAQLEDSGFVEFIAAGAQVSGDFRCADCGYGAVVHNTLPRCPMCGGTVWESRAPLPPPLAD
jgi:rubrerythrin